MRSRRSAWARRFLILPSDEYREQTFASREEERSFLLSEVHRAEDEAKRLCEALTKIAESRGYNFTVDGVTFSPSLYAARVLENR